MNLFRIPDGRNAYAAGMTLAAYLHRFLVKSPGLSRAFLRGFRDGWG